VQYKRSTRRSCRPRYTAAYTPVSSSACLPHRYARCYTSVAGCSLLAGSSICSMHLLPAMQCPLTPSDLHVYFNTCALRHHPQRTRDAARLTRRTESFPVRVSIHGCPFCCKFLELGAARLLHPYACTSATTMSFGSWPFVETFATEMLTDGSLHKALANESTRAPSPP
jgi:hypothetical protein